jgi:hypothetical protein
MYIHGMIVLSRSDVNCKVVVDKCFMYFNCIVIILCNLLTWSTTTIYMMHTLLYRGSSCDFNINNIKFHQLQ